MPSDPVFYLNTLISSLLEGVCDVEVFCEKYCNTFNRMDVEDFKQFDASSYRSLATMACRFSLDTKDLLLPNVYFGPTQIIEKAREVRLHLGL